MGLFSSKKTTPATVNIPPDILADVNVNGAKKSSATEPSAPVNLPIQSASTSPFLKSKGPDASTPLPVKQPAPAQEVPVTPPPAPVSTPTPPAPVAPAPIPAPNPSPAPAPKPFQFADQDSSMPPEIRFTDTPATPAPTVSAPAQQRPDFSQITQDQALAQKANSEQLAPLSMAKNKTATEKKPFLSSANILSGIVFILILTLISGGSWYYLNTRTESTPEVTPEASIEQLPETPAPDPGSTVLVDQPNYLNLNIETVTLEEIKGMLEQEAEKMKSGNITTATEYLVLDSNANPVAFSRFALLIGANTPSDLVDASLEPFSLYLYLDQGVLRMAMAVTLKSETPATFPANKNVLPESLRKFFYPAEYATTDFTKLTFGQGTYQNNTVFYTNIDEAKNFSFDMSSQEGTLTIANSKNALRAVIDKRTLVPTE
jgi:hypothetical protein